MEDYKLKKNINNSLIYYSRIGKLDIVNKLISLHCEINTQNRNKNTALIYASRHGYYKIVKKLLENKADCNIQGENNSTALIWASRNFRVDIVKLLLKYKANYNLTDEYKMTATMWTKSIECCTCFKKNKKNEKINEMIKEYECNQIRYNINLIAPYVYNDIVELIIKFIIL